MHKILMVDDEPDLDMLILQRFRREIKEGTYNFFFARHGAEALKIVKEQPDISIVLSDLNMPEMNGIELLKVLKKDHSYIKVIILSAYSDQENRDLAFKSGARDFITKPVSFKELDQKLKLLISNQ